MTNCKKHTLTIIALLILVINIVAAFCEEIFLKKETVELLLSLGKTRWDYYDALWPDETVIKSQQIPLSKVPKGTVKRAVEWIKLIIKSDWLPNGFENNLIAVKDLVKEETKAGDELAEPFKLQGDYLITKYDINGQKIQLQENDSSVSILIFFPKSISIEKNPQEFIRNCLEKYTNFPKEKANKLSYDLKKDKNIYFGDVDCEWVDYSEAIMAGETVKSNMWWQSFTIFTDGSFIFISAGENDGLPVRLNSSPGYPSRF